MHQRHVSQFLHSVDVGGQLLHAETDYLFELHQIDLPITTQDLHQDAQPPDQTRLALTVRQLVEDHGVADHWVLDDLSDQSENRTFEFRFLALGNHVVKESVKLLVELRSVPFEPLHVPQSQLQHIR